MQKYHCSRCGAECFIPAFWYLESMEWDKRPYCKVCLVYVAGFPDVDSTLPVYEGPVYYGFSIIPSNPVQLQLL